MAAKLKKKAAAEPVETVTDESALKAIGKKIMEIPEQIWQAGLGAFQKAQEQGSKLFETLVKEGSALEAATTKFTSKRVQEVRGAVESTMNTVKDRAADTWDRLEKVFEDRVSKALGALGIPGRRDLDELAKQVAELQKAIGELKKTAGKPEAASKAEQVVKAVKAAPAKAVKAVQAAPEQARKVVAKAKQVASDIADKASDAVKDLTK